MIKQEVIEQVRQATDIVDLVGGYVPLKKVGRNYRGLCPFHSERTPSFHVSPERQSYHCFGCGAGGTAISFVMALEKLEFPEAVAFLAKRAGIRVEVEQVSGRNQALYDACEQATVFFEQQLAKSEPARAYLERRGLGSETARRFRLGFAAGGNLLRGNARKRNWPEEVLVNCGLLIRREEGASDYFRERLMCPIFSLSGKVVGFGGRVLGDGEPKYLNSPDTAIYRKGDNLYGAFQAKAYLREEVPVLVEGNFDLLSLVDCGINRVVAPLGTALTPQQAQLLRRYNSRVIVCFDGDSAGRKAARRSLETLLAAGIDPQVALLPEGTDPDSYVRKHGREEFMARLAAAQDFVDFVLAGRVMETVAQQRLALGELVLLLRTIADGATRELYANRISDRFRVDKAVLLSNAGKPRVAAPSAGAERLIEEKLLGSAIQDAELARIAREFGLSEIVSDESLKPIARVAEELCDADGFGPRLVMDSIEEEARRRVALWTFVERTLPAAAEFRERMRRLRADWLHRRIVAADREGSEERADELTRERNRLLQDVSKERSSRP